MGALRGGGGQLWDCKQDFKSRGKLVFSFPLSSQVSENKPDSSGDYP